MKFHLIPCCLVLAGSSAAFADDVFLEDVIVEGNICAGSDACIDGEVFGDTDLRLKGFVPELQFLDTSTTGVTWNLTLDDPDLITSDAISFRDEDNGTFPFVIEAGARDAALHIDASGDVGFGTTMPTGDLHVFDEFVSSLTLEVNENGGYGYSLIASGRLIGIRDSVTAMVPFTINGGAPSNSFVIADNGNIGIRTSAPQAPFEVNTFDTFSFFRLTADSAAVNKSVDFVFTGGPLGTGQLRYNIVDGDAQEMSLDADGNMILDGTLTTAGPTCAGGCDRVFDAGYALPSIQDHADQMFDLGHLPSLSPTLPGQPVNVTERMGEMLNALEHAHLYIAQLQTQVQDERTNATHQAQLIAELTARLDAMDTALPQAK